MKSPTNADHPHIFPFAYLHIILIFLLLIITSCTHTRYIPVTTTDHARDTIHTVTIRHDSIRLHDSIYITQITQGDTILITRDHYHLRDRTQIIHDTLRQVHTDTIIRPVTITATPSADNAPRWWHWLRGILLLLMSALIIIFALRQRNP